MRWLFQLSLLTILVLVQPQKTFRPCSEISRELKFPCSCALGPVEHSLDGNPAIHVNCDRVVFPVDQPIFPYGAPIVSFSQKWAGHQSLPSQVFASPSLPLRSLDFSGNSLRRLTETLLQNFQSSLIELRLADNLLGDTLNPIFSSNEFHALTHLQVLDLSGNQIKAIEEGILEGCKNLQELRLDRNSLATLPSSSLNGPTSLRTLSLKNNRIGVVKTGAFQAQKNLEVIDLTDNRISSIDGKSFVDLQKLKVLRLSRNRLTRFNSDVFEGADNLHFLDLSENFIVEFPSVALKAFNQLKYLNLSANLIQKLDNNDLESLVHLYQLDLSRNQITNIVPGTFLGLKQLRKLDISVNSLRTIEDDAFEGLDNLEFLNIKDNNILLIPASALGRLPKLSSLQMDYNRIAALSSDILRSIAERVTSLDISKNIVRELPQASFQYFKKLQHLDLTRNLITNLNTNAFAGLEETLVSLRLPQNRIGVLSGSPLVLNRLKILDLSENHLGEFSKNMFSFLPALVKLNLSHNQLSHGLSSGIFDGLPQLEVVDLSYNGLKLLSPEMFAESRGLRSVDLSHNSLGEITDNSFVNLPNLTSIDLSFNNINNIRPGAFVNIMNIRRLSLKGNQMSSFKGELFNTGTSLEILDISDNQLSYLFPSSFRIHPRLKEIYGARNKFNFFPAELIATLQFLEYIDLSGNDLKTVDELDFARLPRLRNLILSGNNLESVSEMAFHNSTQLQVLDLSYNNLERIGERTFEGLIRIETLNLEGNSLSELPETVFDRTRLQMLENVNLAKNKFQIAPLKSLQRQYFFVVSVDLSHNKIQEIPPEDSIMVNIKKLDLSFNPLTNESINNILGEPKTVRYLNLAGTGIAELARLETPFLKHLNVSFNNITSLSDKTFERTTLLENLDISNNQISDLTNLWTSLKSLQTLNISSNPIKAITQEDFIGLNSLKHLSMHSLLECAKIEKSAFKPIPNIADLEAYNFPKLGYMDLYGLLQNVPSLERLNIETKDAAVGSDQLEPVLQPRLKELGLMGPRLRSISSGTFTGVKGPEVTIKLINTSLTSLPPALFFSVPRSSKIILDVSGSQLSTLSPQMLVTLDDRRGDLRIEGLENNPIICDCNSRALRRWLPSHMTTLRCSAPEPLLGKLLVEIADDDLSCDPRKLTTTSTTQTSTPQNTRTTRYHLKTTEPEIIWSVATEKTKTKMKLPISSQSTLNNEDTLIIGIVGGVVAFIAILIIVICIIRLRMSGSEPPVSNGVVVGPGSSCACSVKGAPPIYSLPPTYAPGYATLPHKLQTGPPSIRPSNYSTMGRAPYYQNSQPYFIAAYATDEKIYR